MISMIALLLCLVAFSSPAGARIIGVSFSGGASGENAERMAAEIYDMHKVSARRFKITSEAEAEVIVTWHIVENEFDVNCFQDSFVGGYTTLVQFLITFHKRSKEGRLYSVGYLPGECWLDSDEINSCMRLIQRGMSKTFDDIEVGR